MKQFYSEIRLKEKQSCIFLFHLISCSDSFVLFCQHFSKIALIVQVSQGKSLTPKGKINRKNITHLLALILSFRYFFLFCPHFQKIKSIQTSQGQLTVYFWNAAFALTLCSHYFAHKDYIKSVNQYPKVFRNFSLSPVYRSLSLGIVSILRF